MKKKPVKNILLLLTVIVVLAIVYFLLKAPGVTENKTYQLLNNMLKKTSGSQNVAALTNTNTLPMTLTENQTYGQSLMSKDAVHVLVIGPDVSGSNYDTLLIAGLDAATGEIKLLNLPRDLYINYSPEVLARLQKNSPKTYKSTPARKINAAHIIGKHIDYRQDNLRFGSSGLDFTADLIQEVFDIRIDDVVIIKPSAFRKIIDQFGGVDIDVPYRMHYSDPTQNLVIDLQKGPQHLDGNGTEGFVRFRQGTDAKGKHISIGDTARKENQVDFVKAFTAQKLTLGNLGKMMQTAAAMDEYIQTSIESPEKRAAYIKLGTSLSKNLSQSSEEVVCVNFKKNKIYFLRFATVEERAKMAEKKK